MIEELPTPQTWLVMYRRVIRNGQTGPESLMYEGEIPLADQQQQQVDLKGLLGDGHGRVVVGREASEKDYGNGGSVYVSVAITCDQSEPILDLAARWAGHFTARFLEEQHAELKNQLTRIGILR